MAGRDDFLAGKPVSEAEMKRQMREAAEKRAVDARIAELERQFKGGGKGGRR